MNYDRAFLTNMPLFIDCGIPENGDLKESLY